MLSFSNLGVEVVSPAARTWNVGFFSVEGLWLFLPEKARACSRLQGQEEAEQAKAKSTWISSLWLFMVGLGGSGSGPVPEG